MGLISVGIDREKVYLKNTVTDKAVGMTADLARDFARFLRRDFKGDKESFGPLLVHRDGDAVIFEEEAGSIFIVVPPDAIPLISKALSTKAGELDVLTGKIDRTLDQAILDRLGISNLLTTLGEHHG